MYKIKNNINLKDNKKKLSIINMKLNNNYDKNINKLKNLEKYFNKYKNYKNLKNNIIINSNKSLNELNKNNLNKVNDLNKNNNPNKDNSNNGNNIFNKEFELYTKIYSLKNENNLLQKGGKINNNINNLKIYKWRFMDSDKIFKNYKKNDLISLCKKWKIFKFLPLELKNKQDISNFLKLTMYMKNNDIILKNDILFLCKIFNIKNNSNKDSNIMKKDLLNKLKYVNFNLLNKNDIKIKLNFSK